MEKEKLKESRGGYEIAGGYGKGRMRWHPV
jgi:hypothetical protein